MNLGGGLEMLSEGGQFFVVPQFDKGLTTSECQSTVNSEKVETFKVWS